MGKNMEIKYNFLFITPLLILLYSCSSFQDKKNNINKILSTYSPAINKITLIEEEQIKNINYPLIQIRTNNVIKHTVMLPISNRNGFSNYISGNKQSLTLSGTLITKTNGFNANLISVVFDENSPLIKKQRVSLWPQKSKRIYTFVTPTHKFSTIEFKCEFLIKGKEKIIILKNKDKILTKVEENCKGQNLNFLNIYWADESGFVWKSKQWISEKIIADMTVLKI